MLNKIPTDKLLHLLVCFSIALVAWLLIGPLIPPNSPIMYVIVIRVLISFVVVSAFAIGKELRDRKQRGNHFCSKDLLWDAVGATLGCVVGVVNLIIS